MYWEKIFITNDRGEEVEALAPVVVSASRATDVPAFYAREFMNRIRKGYLTWKNPFNGVCSYISFAQTKVIVFWSKNPRPLMPFLRELEERGIHYYFQFTLNDYEAEGLEPYVPPLPERMDTFRQLAEQVGKEKVIWRFDPLLLSPEITPQDLLEKIDRTGSQLRGCCEKLVFSFVDVKAYRSVRLENAEPNEEQMHYIAQGLAALRERWRSEGWEIELASCAEVINLERYGIRHNRCVDSELIRRLFPSVQLPPHAKDKGQRKACGCTPAKDIGAYHTCPHFCSYCYANNRRHFLSLWRFE